MFAAVSFESDLIFEALFLVEILYNFKALLVVGKVQITAVSIEDRVAKLFFCYSSQ